MDFRRWNDIVFLRSCLPDEMTGCQSGGEVLPSLTGTRLIAGAAAGRLAFHEQISRRNLSDEKRCVHTHDSCTGSGR
jgi:hypothetical protein